VNVFELRDPVSSLSHLATAIWAVFATVLMVRLTAPGKGRRFAVLVYGLSMVVLFLASGLFHGLYYETYEEKRFFQKLDQSAVFILIAGTSTPVLAFLLTGALRRWFLRTVWAFALTGVACQWLLPKPPHALMVGLYLGLGWLGLVPILHYYRAVGWRAMNWVWLGAAFYTLGAICELTQWPVIIPGWVQAHEVLHFCDSAASMAFFLFILRYVVPRESPALQPDFSVASLANGQ
jgi:hemolysin III